MKIRKLS